MSHLIPTPITDKNGKQNTVRKRPAAPSAGRKTMPAPGLPSSAAAPSETPLHVFEVMNREDRDLYLETDPFGDSPTVERMLRREISLETLSLMKHLNDTGQIPTDDIFMIAYSCFRTPGSHHVHNGLVSIAYLRKHHPDIMEGNNIAAFVPFVNGYEVNSVDGQSRKAVTEEDVASVAALLHLSRTLGSDPKTWQFIRSGVTLSENQHSLVISNKHLDRLTREFPSRVHDIISYIRDRGMHRTNKRDVTALREYLSASSVAPAVGEGWL